MRQISGSYTDLRRNESRGDQCRSSRSRRPECVRQSVRDRARPAASLDQVETALWTALLALGRPLIALYLARVAARPRATEYTHDGAKYVVVGSEKQKSPTLSLPH